MKILRKITGEKFLIELTLFRAAFLMDVHSEIKVIHNSYITFL